MKKSKLFLTAALLIITFCLSIKAELIAYESFDYSPADTVLGLNGGTGWSGPWAGNAADGKYKVVSPGLEYTNGNQLYTKGNSCHKINSTFSYAERELPVQSGAEGTTNWFSLLFNFQSTVDPALKSKVWFIFHGIGPGNGTKIRYDSEITNQWLLNDLPSGHNVVSGETVFAVVEVVYGSAFDHLSFWINPAVGSAPDYNNAVTGSGTHVTAVDNFAYRGYAGNPNCILDELRIGETWQDVIAEQPSIDQPVNQSPENKTNNVPLQADLQASGFVSHDGSSHEQSNFKVVSLDGIVALDTTTAAQTTLTLPSGVLNENTRYYWSVRYKSNSNNWSLSSESTSFDTTFSGTPSLYSYDGAAYNNTTDIDGLSGGEGWRDNWQRISSDQAVSSPGLSYQTLATTGGTFIASSVISGEKTNKISRARREISREGLANLLTPDNQFGAPGTTNWFGTIIKTPDSISERHSFGFSVVKANDSINYPNMYVGKYSTSDKWGIGVYATSFKESDVMINSGEEVFLLTRIIYTPTNSTAALWINPDVGQAPPETPDAERTDSPLLFDRIGFFAQSSTNGANPETGFDEIRIGSTWQQVIPEDASKVIPDKPVIVSPANGSVNIVLPVSVQGTAFSAASGTIISSRVKFVSADGIEIYSGSSTESAVVNGLGKDTRYSWQIRYLGSASPDTWSAWSDSTSLETELFSPRLICYDGATYSETDSIDGLAGGFGWMEPWAAFSYKTGNIPVLITKVGVKSPGLMYDTLPVNGLSFITDDDATNSTLATRKIVTGDGYAHLTYEDDFYGRPGSTNWLSFIIECGDNYTNGTYGVGLFKNSVRKLEIRKDINNNWWSYYGLANGFTSTGFTNLSTFLAMRLVHSDEGMTNGQAHLWLNPMPDETSPDLTNAILSDIDINNFEFNTIALFATGNGDESSYSLPPKAKIDELRFAESWNEVIAVPEPVLFIIYYLSFIIYWRKLKY